MSQFLKAYKWQLINGFSLFALIVAVIRVIELFLETFPSQVKQFGLLGALVYGRMFVINGDYGNHAIVFLLVIWTICVNVALTPWGLWLKSAKVGILSAIISAFAVPALHETIWNISWILLHGFSSNMIPAFKSPLEATSLWLIAGPIGIAVYLFFFRKDRRQLIFLGVFAWGIWLFYFVWILSGFPITLNFNGATTLFYDFNTNLYYEIGSWVYACGLFLFLRIMASHRVKLAELYARKDSLNTDVAVSASDA